MFSVLDDDLESTVTITLQGSGRRGDGKPVKGTPVTKAAHVENRFERVVNETGVEVVSRARVILSGLVDLGSGDNPDAWIRLPGETVDSRIVAHVPHFDTDGDGYSTLYVGKTGR